MDNGHGTDNPAPLFVLADSDWEAEVEANQQPAGWGLFFLYSIARTVSFVSKFGDVTVDCEEYLNSAEYRADVLDHVKTGRSAKGFGVSAHLKPEAVAKLITEDPYETYKNSLCCFLWTSR